MATKSKKTSKKTPPKPKERVNMRILGPTHARLMMCKKEIQNEIGIASLQTNDFMELLMSGKHLKITKKIHDDKSTLTAD